MTHSRRTSWDGKPLAVNGGDTDLPDEALHNSAVVGSSNAPVEPTPVDATPESAAPGSLGWLEATTVKDVLAWLDENEDQRAAVVRLERRRGDHARKGITGDD